MKQRLTLFFVSLFLFVGAALAQTKVTGTVLSQEDGQPIIGAAVKVVGTSTGMLTDVNGRFTVAMPEGKDQLEVSYLGYQSKTVKAKANMRVFLKTDAQVVDEVVVTGYGSQRKASFTGAASKVDGAVVEKKSDANFVKGTRGNHHRCTDEQLVEHAWYMGFGLCSWSRLAELRNTATLRDRRCACKLRLRHHEQQL